LPGLPWTFYNIMGKAAGGHQDCSLGILGLERPSI